MDLLFPKTIVSVEDTPSHQVLIERAFHSQFSKDQIKLVFIKDGAKAVEYIKNNEVDLVLLDWNLPIKSGYQVLIETKNGQKSPIMVVLSTSESEKDQKMAYEAGATAYFVKPVSFVDFKEIAEIASKFWFNDKVRLPKRGWYEH